MKKLIMIAVVAAALDALPSPVTNATPFSVCGLVDATNSAVAASVVVFPKYSGFSLSIPEEHKRGWKSGESGVKVAVCSGYFGFLPGYAHSRVCSLRDFTFSADGRLVEISEPYLVELPKWTNARLSRDGDAGEGEEMKKLTLTQAMRERKRRRQPVNDRPVNDR